MNTLLDLIQAYGQAMQDCGYFSDGSQPQEEARTRSNKLFAEIERLINPEKNVQSFLPDWREVWTAKQAEKQIGLEFKGPGIYHKGNDTLLAIPLDRTQNLWHQKFNPEERFEFLVYNERNPANAINALINAPTRT